MDRVVTATRKTFGRPVTYTPKGGAAVPMRAIFQLAADFFEKHEIGVSTNESRLDFRTLDFKDAGLDPDNNGDVVTLADPAGVMRAYKVTDVRPASPYTTHIVLGRRSS